MFFAGLADKKNCSSPVEKPGTFAGYSISDTELGVRFTKPITDDYDYWLYFKKQTAQGYILSRYWTTYGPIWSDVIEGLQAQTYYNLAVRLSCSYNSSIKSPMDRDIIQTLPKRKRY